MHWNTLKIVTVVALLASPSAFAAIPGAGAIDAAANTFEAPRPMQLADHRDDRDEDRRRSFYRSRPHDTRGNGHYRDDRHHRHPHYRGQPRRHYRDRPHRHYRGRPHRHFRGRPFRRWFRHWRRHH